MDQKDMRPRRAIPKMSTAKQPARVAEEAAPAVSALKEKSEPKYAKRPWMKKRKAARLRPGQPNYRSKLDDEIEEKICGLIRVGLSDQDAGRLAGISRETIWDWKCRGEAEPESRYGRFLEKIQEAVIHREAHHLNFISRDNDWKARRWLLCNWHPDRYRDRIIQELSGPEGAPIPVAANPFAVTVVLATDPEATQPEFTVREHAKNGNGERP
jgi:hypothetical protein